MAYGVESCAYLSMLFAELPCKNPRDLVELCSEPACTFGSADNVRKYCFERNFTDSRRPSSIHGVILDGDPLVIFGASGGVSSVHVGSLAYVQKLLYLAAGDSVACVQLKPFLFKWALKTDTATCFGVHFQERTGALVSHGELEVVRFSAEGSILWRTSGVDIFTGAFSLQHDCIEAVDWNGRVYHVNYHDGKEPFPQKSG
jgi:hypothetical protein